VGYAPTALTKSKGMYMRKRWSIKEIADFLNEFDYKLISTEYKTQKDKLEMICPNGHEASISFDNFKNGKRCNDCHQENKSILFRKDIKEVELKYNEIGYTVVRGLDSYENQKSPLVVECDKGHQYDTYYQCLSAGSKCPTCFGKYVNFEDVKNKFKEKDYTLLEDSYYSSNTPMGYICNKHPDEIQYVTWDNLRQDRACRFCGREKIANSRRLNFEQVKSYFTDKGYILHEEKYVNNTTKMKYTCLKHNHEIQETDLNCLIFSKNTCKYCIVENRSGRNSILWKNGKNNIADYLRKNINIWKLDSMKESNYKCVVTGEKFDAIHHLYSFNKIVDETIEELGLEAHKTIGEYTDSELQDIRNKCLEIHYRYPLGVCLSEDVHRKYHSKYGFDNTPEQFYEFKKNYQLQILN
jgi:hypothetical protein